MLGKDARSTANGAARASGRIGRRLVAGAAVLAAATGLATSSASAAPVKAQPYIDVQDVVTNVGQRPKLVVTYGNKGGRTLLGVFYSCWAVRTDGSVRYSHLNYDTYRSPLLPGQSANLEIEGTAVKVGRRTKVKCFIQGIEQGTLRARSDYSRVATIRVNR